MTIDEMLKAAGPASCYVPVATNQLITGLANAVRQLQAQLGAVTAEAAQMRQIIDSITNLDNEPQYHEQGMGCGLEDRNITDRYEAMRHGWDEAMERVYAEVIPCAEELSFPAFDAIRDSLRAEGVEMFAQHLRTDGSAISVCRMIAVGADEFARQLRESKGANHESDI
ncbi:hypothetical protein [Leclercia adecarboxylata]|uniref:hypothetical protein n=1 Tax=Leclercia adecarboxylata TaxID=83655 RepID=UPI00255018F4|nr:hypothetical protein [Leclercia adecarboxylata]